MRPNEISFKVIGAAMHVHSVMGSGLVPHMRDGITRRLNAPENEL